MCEVLNPTARKETPKFLILQLPKAVTCAPSAGIKILLGYFCSRWSSARLFHVKISLPGQCWNSSTLHLSPISNCSLGSEDLDNFHYWESSLIWFSPSTPSVSPRIPYLLAWCSIVPRHRKSLLGCLNLSRSPLSCQTQSQHNHIFPPLQET